MTAALSVILKTDVCELLGYSEKKHGASGACSEAFLKWLRSSGRKEHLDFFLAIITDVQELYDVVTLVTLVVAGSLQCFDSAFHRAKDHQPAFTPCLCSGPMHLGPRT